MGSPHLREVVGLRQHEEERRERGRHREHDEHGVADQVSDGEHAVATGEGARGDYLPCARARVTTLQAGPRRGAVRLDLVNSDLVPERLRIETEGDPIDSFRRQEERVRIVELVEKSINSGDHLPGRFRPLDPLAGLRNQSVPIESLKLRIVIVFLDLARNNLKDHLHLVSFKRQGLGKHVLRAQRGDHRQPDQV